MEHFFINNKVPCSKKFLYYPACRVYVICTFHVPIPAKRVVYIFCKIMTEKCTCAKAVNMRVKGSFRYITIIGYITAVI